MFEKSSLQSKKDIIDSKTELIRSQIQRCVEQTESVNVRHYLTSELELMITKFFPTFSLNRSNLDIVVTEVENGLMNGRVISQQVADDGLTF